MSATTDGGAAARLAARWVRPELRELSAYHVPASAGLIKLDAMENPYPWPESMVDDWLNALRRVRLNRYPDAAAADLKQSLRAAFRIPDELALVLGNGSDEIIQMIGLALAGPGRVVLAPVPTFVMYEMIARFVGAEFVGVPLAEDFDLDMPQMLSAIDRHQPAVVFLAYPNNPTGNLFAADAIQDLIDAAPGLVVLDEAYHAFAAVSWLDRGPLPDNVVVMRTVSKLGLAGLRLGYLIGADAWLDEFEKVRLPYNINALTQTSAAFALARRAEFDQQARSIVSERGRMAEALAAAGYRVYPSAANFLLFRASPDTADKLFRELLDAGVLIKNLHRAGTPLADCLRVTVGTPAENSAFLDALPGAGCPVPGVVE